ncbi:unnamed protein product [Polarella glacialis]|uniref:Sushi domain-containing protein n=1 Tax=Polarella glacialis TaxID=89957 RepID=A0A813M0E2_POLGL|nr:unnamed protein product [Polarella glacialis]CAE8742867.1 unnamed protein product [Polarella glacialis]
MAAVVFWHFGASGVSLALRFYTRRSIECVSSCFRCCQRCLRCCCRSGTDESAGASGGARDVRVVAGQRHRLSSVVQLKWYWFHLALQGGFLTREVLLISKLDGWCLEVSLAQLAIWLTLLIVVLEVWNFSKVRGSSEKQKVAVDSLFDMLLLPVNIGFFCTLCVRILKLQPSSHVRTMVAVVIESPDIYEALALWSVLELFVKVVDAEAGKDPQRDADARSSFGSFKSISLQGVKAWAFIQSVAVAAKLVLQGVVAVYFPTLCYWVSKSCKSCNDLYEDNVAAALGAVTFILCSFAIMFVFYFEAGYRRYLHDIGPMWKFLGVKGIVSVTYFQWLVISMLARWFNWDDTNVYLWHCLLYAFWMPVLAVFHATLAYPFQAGCRGSESQSLAPWLTSWLRTVRINCQRDCETTASSADVDAPRRPNSPPAAEAAEGSELPQLRGSRAEDDAGGSPCASPLRMHRHDLELAEVQLHATDDVVTDEVPARLLLLYLVFGMLCLYCSVKLVLRLVPLEDASDAIGPLRNITCTDEGDLAHFLQSRNDLNFQLLNDTTVRWRNPGVAGAWLPLCASTQVGCQLGHYPKHSLPSLMCTAAGHYTWAGECEAISCGKPPRLPHATPRMSDVASMNWTYGVTVHYDCRKPGWRGNLQALCNITGTWVVSGLCEEIICGPSPDDVPHATPVLNPNRTGENVSTGMAVRYQCDDMYNGTPTATCGDDGMYVKEGRCRKECAPPPSLLHASANFDNVITGAVGWLEGMRADYLCDPGFEGHMAAVCGADGNYTTAGNCAEPSARRVHMLEATVGIESSLLLLLAGVFTWHLCRRSGVNRQRLMLDLLGHSTPVSGCNPVGSGNPVGSASCSPPAVARGTTPNLNFVDDLLIEESEPCSLRMEPASEDVGVL